jgi:hypothetical protein
MDDNDFKEPDALEAAYRMMLDSADFGDMSHNVSDDNPDQAFEDLQQTVYRRLRMASEKEANEVGKVADRAVTARPAFKSAKDELGKKVQTVMLEKVSHIIFMSVLICTSFLYRKMPKLDHLDRQWCEYFAVPLPLLY